MIWSGHFNLYLPMVLPTNPLNSSLSLCSRSGSPCMSSRSSPLIGPPPRGSSSPCLPVGPQASEPFSDGADLQVANLDYRMSRKELQQSLHDAFSRHGLVSPVQTVF